MNEKKRLRQMMKKRLSQVNQSSREKWSSQIAAKLFMLQEWTQAKMVAVTISLEKEVSTRLIIEQAWQEGKSIVVPKCNPQSHEMTFRRLLSYNQLEDGYAGIKEPVEAVTDVVSPSEIDVMIVPGLVFDRFGYRIGYGGGYYDRYLQTFHGFTISLAFTCQMIEKVPAAHFDLPVNRIITDRQVFYP